MNTTYKKLLLSLTILLVGIFTTQAQELPTPGGSTDVNFTMWLTPESYNNGVWTNLMPDGVGNFTQPTNWTTRTAPLLVNEGLNFHPTVRFRRTGTGNNAPNRLISQHPMGVQSDEAFTIIMVFRPVGAHQASSNILNWAPTNTASNTPNFVSAGGLGYLSGSMSDMRMGWGTAAGNNNTTDALNNPRRLNAMPVGQHYLFAVDNNNSGAAGIRSYLNGVRQSAAPQTGQAGWSTTDAGNTIVIGAGSGNALHTTGSFGADVDIQEIILLRRPRASVPFMADVNEGRDFQKIHSYLAIKYGISLDAGNYYATDGTVVWNRTAMNGFNNHIFGIGRDDRTRLYQRQAVSSSSNILTLFVGSALSTLNRDNDGTLNDRQFLMVGSNNQPVNNNIVYNHSAGTSFANGTTINSRLSFRSALIYRAQLTGGVSQTVNMRVNNTRMRYVLVSSDAGFALGTTRAYPISNGLAMNVVVNNNDFISFAGFEAAPGGVQTHTLNLWFDGNNSTTTAWNNEAGAFTTHSLQRGVHFPTVRNSRFNFHQELFFGDDRNRKLRTTANYDLAPGESYIAFVVSEHLGTGEQVIVSFNNETSNAGARRSGLRWNTAAGDILFGWNATQTTVNDNTTLGLSRSYGIASTNVLNTSGAGNGTVSINGISSNFTVSQQTVTNYFFIGSGSTNMTATGSAGDNLNFSGTIQEVILMRGAAGVGQMSPENVQRIQSYLAIKYGITIAHNYVNTAGTTVWDRTANNGDFNHHIFGIGRDNATALYQRQSRSSSSDMLTLFVGSGIAPLNSQNNGTLQDMQYVMLGANNADPATEINSRTSLDYIEGELFASGEIDFKLNFRSNLIYRAQVTGVTSADVNIHINNTRFSHVFVSSSQGFAPLSTRLYEIEDQIAAITLNDGEFITFGGFQPTPGGIAPELFTLNLWIDGNNSTNTTWTNLAPATHELERGSATPPFVRNSSLNFHQELHFSGRNALRTTTNFPIAADDAIYTFVVSSDPAISGQQTLITFRPGTTAANARRAGMQWQGTNARAAWQTGDPTDTQWAAHTNSQRFGIMAMNLQNNAGADGGVFYFNGVPTPLSTANNTVSPGSRLLLGDGDERQGSSVLTFSGAMQEVIVMRRAPGQPRLNAGQIARINSYLAVKYGITLGAGNYYASDGTVIWERADFLQSGDDFTHNVFGLGRDDFSGLDQRQARSASSRFFTLYTGTLTTLNRDNRQGRLADQQFLMVGSTGGMAIQMMDSNDFEKTGYLNVDIVTEPENAYNIQSPHFRVQLTGMEYIQVRFRAPADFLHVQVSTTPDFTPAETKNYAVVMGGLAAGNYITLGNNGGFGGRNFLYFRFVGFAPGPGGVTRGLRMWLRADDEMSLNIEHRTSDNLFPNVRSEASTDPLWGFGRDADFPTGSLTADCHIPAVFGWSDLARGHHYVFLPEGRRRTPVLNPHAPEMNFHPAVRFWGESDRHSSFLINLHAAGDVQYDRVPIPEIIQVLCDETGEWISQVVTIEVFCVETGEYVEETVYTGFYEDVRIYGGNPMGVNAPDHGEHHAFFLTANDFSTNNWFYVMSFGDALRTGTGTIQPVPDVAFGAQQLAGNRISGRFRLRPSNTVRIGTTDMFTEGATSLLGFSTHRVAAGGATNSNVRFQFNSVRQENYGGLRNNPRPWPARSFGSHNSVLGSGFNHNRTMQGYMSEVVMFDRALSPADTRLIESYFALKYGLTLRPNHNQSGVPRFNFTFSGVNPRQIWMGENAADTDHKAIFYNNIAAVIRDDAARLHNRQAMSTDVGSVLNMGLGNVLGAHLTNCGSYLGNFRQDLDAVVWGSTAPRTEGFVFARQDEDECGEWDYRFRRIWRIENLIQPSLCCANPNIQMVVGARNNSRMFIGRYADPETQFIYQQLHAGNNLVLIVANSPYALGMRNDGSGIVDQIDNFNPIMVIPMYFVEGLHQVLKTFPPGTRYITFGFKPNSLGCFGDEEDSFTDALRFNWTQWVRDAMVRANVWGATYTRPPFSTELSHLAIGEIGVVRTSINYHSQIRSGRNFPRMARGGWLEIRRRGRNVRGMQDVTITLHFGERTGHSTYRPVPVVPEFQISGIDGRSRSFDRVTISGGCGEELFVMPDITHAGRANLINIQGNTATAAGPRRMRQTAVDGMVNVEFQGGVTEVEIRYALNNRARGTQRIYISPITMRSWDSFLPPPLSAAGVAFTKRASAYEVTTCDIVTYTFFIQNVNCHDKYADFSDMLPPGMMWVPGTLGLGPRNSTDPECGPGFYNERLIVNNYGGGRELSVQYLRVPAGSTLRVSIQAEFTDYAETGFYDNRAVITYFLTSVDFDGNVIVSTDWNQRDLTTRIFAQYQTRQEEVMLSTTWRPTMYREGDIITVRHTIYNPNDPISGMFLDVDFTDLAIFDDATGLVLENEGYLFELITDGFAFGGFANNPVLVELERENFDAFFELAGNSSGENGFVLPAGESWIEFRIRAPQTVQYLVEYEIETDEYGNPTGEYTRTVTDRRPDLEISFEFSALSEIIDPCVDRTMRNMNGEIVIPFAEITHIRTNRHLVPQPFRGNVQ